MLHNFLEEQECEKKENKENEVESTEVQKVTESPKDPACKEVKTPNDSSQVEKPLKEIESSTDSKQVQESENAEGRKRMPHIDQSTRLKGPMRLVPPIKSMEESYD